MERFEDEFVTWRHKTPVGIKVDEVFGMDCKSGKVWEQLARQIFCELGEPNYRELGHFENGAPYIIGLPARISISHTSHFFVAAFLPKTPESDLSKFSPRVAMGIDAERLDREQVIKLREKFLSDKELEIISPESVKDNIIAWTAKEALYKAAMTPGLSLKDNLRILRLPSLDLYPDQKHECQLGDAIIEFPAEMQMENQAMSLYSYESYGCCITIAYSPKCARYGG